MLNTDVLIALAIVGFAIAALIAFPPLRIWALKTFAVTVAEGVVTKTVSTLKGKYDVSTNKP